MNDSTETMEENKTPGTLRLMGRLLRMCAQGEIPQIGLGC